MNIKIVLILLIGLFSVSLMGQDPFSMNQKEIELNRKNHCLISEIMYVQKVKSNGDLEEKQFRAKSKYNENGLTVDGESDFNGTRLRNTYEYDEFMNTVKSEIYYKDKLKERNVIEYDENGIAYRISLYYQNGRLFNTDKKKVKLKKTKIDKIDSKLNYDSLVYTYYKKSGTNLSKDKYKLDKKGRILEWVDIDNSTYEKSFKKYEYKESQYIESEIFYNYDDTIDRKYIRTYNYKNLLIESKWYNGKGILKQISTYEYGFCTETK
jgi:hypothetical protein